MIFRAHCCIAFHARKTVSLPCNYFFVPNVPHGGATLCGQLHSCSIESKTKPVKKKVLISILNTKVNKTWLIRNQECENTSERFRITPWLLQILYCNFFFFWYMIEIWYCYLKKIITCQGYNSCVQRRCRHDKCSRMYNWCKCQDSACLEGANSLANVRRVGLRCPDFDKKKN